MTTSPMMSNHRRAVAWRAHVVAIAISVAAAMSIARVAAADDCGTGPRTGCRSAGRSSIRIVNGPGDRDRLTWKWRKGGATIAADFGNPLTATTYALCVYAGTSATVIIDAAVPPSSMRWTDHPTKGFTYEDDAGTSDGIQKIVLQAGVEGKAKVLVKGKGANLPDPPAGPLALPLTVQLVNNTTSACFEGVYASTDVVANGAEKFKAKITAVCGNDVIEGAEQCDGTADAACPGQCLSNCTCREPCGSSAPACSGGCPPGQSCAGCVCGPANPTPCGSTAPMCNGACAADEACAADPLVGICYCVSLTSTPCANSLGSTPMCGGVCPTGMTCHQVPASLCTCA